MASFRSGSSRRARWISKAQLTAFTALSKEHMTPSPISWSHCPSNCRTKSRWTSRLRETTRMAVSSSAPMAAV
jgi:hypothetical protein